MVWQDGLRWRTRRRRVIPRATDNRESETIKTRRSRKSCRRTFPRSPTAWLAGWLAGWPGPAVGGWTDGWASGGES